MDSTITTILAAGIAVLGTLLSPILAQYVSMRAKKQEFDLARQQRAEERDANQRLEEIANLRSAYTKLNTEMRRHLRATSNYLHLIRSNRCDQSARAELDGVRHEYLQQYAEAQMILPDRVFSYAINANGGLAQLYGIALRLDGFSNSDLMSYTDPSAQEETIDSALAFLEEVRSRIWILRDVMRSELGVSSNDPASHGHSAV
jgi:hypothetical protein